MKPTLRSAIAPILATVVACGGGDTDPPRASAKSALSMPVRAPVPFNPHTGESWRGTPVELMYADAFASCSYQESSGLPNSPAPDAYNAYIVNQMDTALCRYEVPGTPGVYKDYGDSNAFPGPAILRWLEMRNDEHCNINPSTKTPASAYLDNAGLMTISIPVESPFTASTSSGVTAKLARRAVTLPVTNLCIAQHLRSRSPGASGGEALLLSAADQRQLLVLTKDRAQIAMLQFGLLARMFSTAPVANPGAVSNVTPTTTGSPWSFMPMLQQWAQGGSATTAVLRKLGQDLATAVQLHVTTSEELARLLARSGAAHLPRGGSPLDPAWIATGRTTESVDRWGPGSWKQRALASLYGGDPLVEDESGSTPWQHFDNGSEPGRADEADDAQWPDVNNASFVSVRLTDPKIRQLYALARAGDALYLRSDSAWARDPMRPDDFHAKLECQGVRVEDSADYIYRATEAYVRTNDCSAFVDDGTGGRACRSFLVSDIPAATADSMLAFELWNKHRITKEHARGLAKWLHDVIGKKCRYRRLEFDVNGAYSTNIVDFWGRGALDFSGQIETKSVGTDDPYDVYYHLVDYEPRPRVLRETAPLFSRYTRFWMPPQLYPEADPTSQGYATQSDTHDSGPVYSVEPGEMRLMGAIPALAAMRDALVRAAVDAAVLPASARAFVDAFFEKRQPALAVIENAIGRGGLSVRPTTTLVSSTLTGPLPDLQRPVLKPDYASNEVEITFDPADEFWGDFGGSGIAHSLIAIPDEPMIGSLAMYPGSKAFGRDVAGALLNTRRRQATLTALPSPPAGTVASRACRAVLSMPRSREQWSFIVEKTRSNGTKTYLLLVSHFQKFGTLTKNMGQYLAFGGVLSELAGSILAVDMNDPSQPAFDGFGLPNAWMPPTDPALFGGTAGDDAVASYLRKARASAEEATAAVKTAFETMLEQQQDEAALAAAVSKAEKVGSLERSALCGRATCDTSMQPALPSVQTLWDSAPARSTLQRSIPGGPIEEVSVSRPLWNSLRTGGCENAPGKTFAQTLGLMQPTERLDCLAMTILVRVAHDFMVLSPVLRARGYIGTPSFEEYSGGSLQEVAIEQWVALRQIDDRIRAVIAATDAAIGKVNLYKDELEGAVGEEDEMRSRCEHLESEVLAGNGGYGMGWGDEVTSSEGWSLTVGASAGASFIVGASVNVSNTISHSSSDMSLGAKYRLCQSYHAKVNTNAWRLTEAVLQAYANIQERAAEFTEAAGRLRRAAAAGAALAHATDLAIAKNNLEVSLLRDSQVTSFGVYRQLHSYDAWRAKALLDGARVSAAVARKAIESRYLVNLSELKAPEPLVASPATWADEVYEYDLDMPAAVGLTVGEAVPGGIYANRMVDYVGNLERFVDGYSIARPTVAAHDDAEVISLPGPKGLDGVQLPGTGLPDGRAYAWNYLCGDNAWRPAPPNKRASEACGAAPSRPIRASLLFALDPWGRLHGDIADEPFEARYNARWGRLATNLVGTGILDCSKANDPGACYTQPFVRYRLAHRGVPWVTDAEQSWTTLPVPVGRIEAAKALAAERWLDPIANAWSQPYVSSVARGELTMRPFGGSYEIQFDLGPEVVLERIERVQVLAGSSYWVKQGDVRQPRPGGGSSLPVVSSLNFNLADTAGGEPIEITGANLANAVSCTVGGTNATITANTLSRLTFTMPAKVAGTYDVQVTTGSGVSNTLAIESWSPAQITGVSAYLDSRKGVTLVNGNLETWTDQSANARQFADGHCNWASDVFRAGVGAARFVPNQALSLTGGAKVGMTSGMSVFWVGKWTSADATINHSLGYGVPLTVVGDHTGSIYNGFGASAGQLGLFQYDTGAQHAYRGSGLNDGQVRLCGWASSPSSSGGGTHKAYVGTTQQGAEVSLPYFFSSGYTTIGNTHADTDGFDGDLGAVVIVSGVMSADSMAKLHKWAQAGFGALP